MSNSALSSGGRLRLSRGGVFVRACLIACTAVVATRLFAQTPPAEPASQPAAAAETPAFMRVQEVKGKTIELQVGVRDYVRADGTGPRVGLVGVAHIGERSFYRELQRLLDGYDIVLYESVKPSGATRPGGDTPEARIESTRASMKFVRGLIESYRHVNEGLPANLDALRKFVSDHDPRLAHFVNDASTDAWGHALQYGLLADAADAMDGYRLVSLGADGAVGGDGEQADISLGHEEGAVATALSDEDGLQSQLADALGMEFQLEAMDYGKANWRCSDMDMDQLNRALSDRGLDFEVLGGTLAGSSLPAKLIKVLLGFIKVADSFMQGAITDTFKVVMIEMLGDPALTEGSLKQLGAGFADVIINERNEIPLSDLARIAEHEADIKSVAIFYGAGHMADLDAQLRTMGYVPAADGEHWLTGMKVDLTKSAVSPRELNQIRMMMKQTLKQQFGAK